VIRAKIPSVFVLEKVSSFPQRFDQIRTDSWQGFTMNKTLTMYHQKLRDLIKLVQGYPSLYDTAHSGYKKTKKMVSFGSLLLNSFHRRM
jgi:hypothetical protein